MRRFVPDPGGGTGLNYAAYIANVTAALLAQGFQQIAIPGELAMGLWRQERWGRLLIGVAARVNLAESAQQEALVATVGEWLQAQPEGGQLILLFPFDRRVSEAEAAGIGRLRQGEEGRGWAVIPWTADLEVELLDRHSGFPPVDDQVVRVLTEVGSPESVSRPRLPGNPRTGRLQSLLNLEVVPTTRLLLASTFAYYIWVLLMDGQGGLLGTVAGVLTGPGGDTMITWGSNFSYFTLYAGEQWRLLTHIFLHWGLLHLGINMWSLWALGQHVEMVYGSGRMAFIYLVAGVSGGFASAVLRSGPVHSAGASGAIFGLLGALLYFGATFRERPPNWHGLWTTVGINLLAGFFLGFVDNYAHMGGLVGGALAAFIAGSPGQRGGWRTGAMLGIGLIIALVLSGLIPL